MKNSSDLRTPYAKVHGLGSAQSGTMHFWKQRLTALANVPLVIGFVFLLICLQGKNYLGVRDVLSNSYVSVFLILMVVSITMHMKLGMQVVIEDYIHCEHKKLALLIANTFFCVCVGVAGVYALLKIGFGA